MSIAIFQEALSQEVSNLIENGCTPASVYDYAYHKAEGAAFFAMLSGDSRHTELTEISREFGRLLTQEQLKTQKTPEFTAT